MTTRAIIHSEEGFLKENNRVNLFQFFPRGKQLHLREEVNYEAIPEDDSNKGVVWIESKSEKEHKMKPDILEI